MGMDGTSESEAKGTQTGVYPCALSGSEEHSENQQKRIEFLFLKT